MSPGGRARQQHNVRVLVARGIIAALHATADAAERFRTSGQVDPDELRRVAGDVLRLAEIVHADRCASASGAVDPYACSVVAPRPRLRLVRQSRGALPPTRSPSTT
jgi:hypothetical protein